MASPPAALWPTDGPRPHARCPGLGAVGVAGRDPAFPEPDGPRRPPRTPLNAACGDASDRRGSSQVTTRTDVPEDGKDRTRGAGRRWRGRGSPPAGRASWLQRPRGLLLPQRRATAHAGDARKACPGGADGGGGRTGVPRPGEAGVPPPGSRDRGPGSPPELRGPSQPRLPNLGPSTGVPGRPAPRPRPRGSRAPCPVPGGVEGADMARAGLSAGASRGPTTPPPGVQR